MSRRALVWLLFAIVLFATREVRAESHAWTESHVTGEDVRAAVARDGSVVVTHAISYRVAAGTLRSVALIGFEDDLRFRPTANVTAGDGHATTASVVRDDKDVLHVTVDDPKGLKRGDYRFELTYEMSLAGRATREGAFARVRFALPPMREGVDGARLVLELPSAPTEPRAVTEGDGAADLATLRRTTEHDELELVRPHVAKGEAATFYARVDPKALSQMDDAALREPVVALPVDAPRERPPIARAILVAACALFVFGLALAKGRILPVGASGLVPLPAGARAAIAAAIFAGGALVETTGRVTLGAALVAASLPLLAWRIAAAPRGPRGPAKWLVVRPEEAFARTASRADLLDATTPRGAVVLALAVALVLVLCRLARSLGGAAPYLVAIDSLALVPIFFTGTARQMPPSASREGAALAKLARGLAKLGELKVAPLARVLPDGRVDELRLLASPRLAMSGVTAIEVGVAWQRPTTLFGGAYLPSFDVLVRVKDATFAAAKMTGAFPETRALPGRKPDERVYRFEPDGPSAASCVALVRDLAEILRDRRLVLAAPPFEGEERRLPPNARLPSASPRPSLA